MRSAGLIPVLISIASSAVAADREPFALVELFTSESCSSCPAADRLLSDLIAGPEADDIHALAFHVDYWNHLDWHDPYSRQEYTDRQAAYADELDVGRLYTPQAVINGRTELVGSDAVRLQAAVAAALDVPAELAIRARGERSGGRLTVHYATDGPLAGRALHFALVERGIVRVIGDGENSGRRLVHDNVVREFRTELRPAASGGRVRLTLPEDLREEHASLIVYAQDLASFSIVGATRRPLAALVASADR